MATKDQIGIIYVQIQRELIFLLIFFIKPSCFSISINIQIVKTKTTKVNNNRSNKDSATATDIPPIIVFLLFKK